MMNNWERPLYATVSLAKARNDSSKLGRYKQLQVNNNLALRYFMWPDIQIN